jgi:hypothetical protein
VKARNRPPKLEARVQVHAPAREPTLEEVLVRARVAGNVSRPGPRELRHIVERIGANAVESWAAIGAVFGATPEVAHIDPACTVRAAHAAAARIGAAVSAGGRTAFATAQPASLLPLYAGIVRRVRDAGGEVPDADDAGPLRVDGRGPRWVRTVDGVAIVTDGTALLGTSGPEAADEWMFLTGRPALVIGDGPFADAALSAGVDVVAFAGLERVDLAARTGGRKGCVVVPVHPGRPPRAYAPVASLITPA